MNVVAFNGIGKRRECQRCKALAFQLWMSQTLWGLTDITKEVESEVVLESETNTVGIAAGYCFAEFGTPQS